MPNALSRRSPRGWTNECPPSRPVVQGGLAQTSHPQSQYDQVPASNAFERLRNSKGQRAARLYRAVHSENARSHPKRFPEVALRSARLAPIVQTPGSMRRLAVGLCLLTLSSACSSRAAGRALVEATTVTIMAVGAAALEAAAEEQAERDEQEAKHRSRRVAREPGAWRLVRDDHSIDQRDEANQRQGSSPIRSGADPAIETTTRPRPVISLGHCMVCQ